MPKETITVKYLNPPREGKKRGTIKTTDDRFFGVFPETFHLFNVGGTYEIDYTDGEYANVKTAKQVKAPAAAAPATEHGASAPSPRVRGEGRGEGLPAETLAKAGALPQPERTDYFRQTHPVDAERMFCCALLTAYIKAGKIGTDKAELAAATMMLRGLWNYAFVANGRAAERQAG